LDSIVLDASVCLKWFLPDEGDREQALGLRDKIVRGDLQVFAPSHLPLEIAAGLTQAVRRGRPIEPAVMAALDACSQMDFELVEIAAITTEAVTVALSAGLSPYDAAYVVVADRNKAPLVTADLRLHASASAAGHNIVLLSELPTS